MVEGSEDFRSGMKALLQQRQLGLGVRAERLERSFRIASRTIEVLKGVDLEIAAGESVFLCGASGAGKTTLLYTLAGMEHPESGRVIVGEHALYQLCEADRARVRNELMGFVFQGYFLLPELTALENVLMPAMIHRRDRKEAAMEALAKVGLADRAHHLPAELSGGEQQRVAIARALINDPSIVFADEPTGNLDSRTGASVIDLLLDVVREARRTLVVVTHDTQLATRGDRMITIRDGVVCESV